MTESSEPSGLSPDVPLEAGVDLQQPAPSPDAVAPPATPIISVEAPVVNVEAPVVTLRPEIIVQPTPVTVQVATPDMKPIADAMADFGDAILESVNNQQQPAIQVQAPTINMDLTPIADAISSMAAAINDKPDHIGETCIAGGVAQFSVNELWSRYVDWVAQGDNSKYQPAMRVIGGDAIGGGQYLGSYLFFRNDLGWLGVPPPVDGVTIIIDGAFYAQDPLLPVMENLPNQETSLVMNRSSMVMGIETSGVTGPTANEIAAATVAALSSRVIENGMTNDDLMRMFASILLGKLTGAGTGTERFRDLSDTKDRVVATVDNSGNRTSITLDPT